MKSITKEAVSRIRAMYLGQEVYNNINWDKNRENEEILGNELKFSDSWYLSLRSIADLTDEENSSLIVIGSIPQMLPGLQYLQQIGIALPYYDAATDTHYSVEDYKNLAFTKLEQHDRNPNPIPPPAQNMDQVVRVF